MLANHHVNKLSQKFEGTIFGVVDLIFNIPSKSFYLQFLQLAFLGKNLDILGTF
jgi:hypothetical protein